MKNTPKELEAFRKEIEEKLLRDEIDSKESYNTLSCIINAKLKSQGIKDEKGDTLKQIESVSKETIYRVWGYVPYNGISKKTLGILARSIGYRGWDDYCLESQKKREAQKIFNPDNIGAISFLEKKQQLTLGWYPKKYAIVEYQGDYTFNIIEIVGLRSEIGRSFITTGFRLEENDTYSYPDIIIDPFHDDEPENTPIDYL